MKDLEKLNNLLVEGEAENELEEIANALDSKEPNADLSKEPAETPVENEVNNDSEVKIDDAREVEVEIEVDANGKTDVEIGAPKNEEEGTLEASPEAFEVAQAQDKAVEDKTKTIVAEEAEITNADVKDEVAETTDVEEVKVDAEEVVETAEETTDVEEHKVDEDEVVETAKEETDVDVESEEKTVAPEVGEPEKKEFDVDAAIDSKVVNEAADEKVVEETEEDEEENCEFCGEPKKDCKCKKENAEVKEDEVVKSEEETDLEEAFANIFAALKELNENANEVAPNVGEPADKEFDVDATIESKAGAEIGTEENEEEIEELSEEDAAGIINALVLYEDLMTYPEMLSGVELDEADEAVLDVLMSDEVDELYEALSDLDELEDFESLSEAFCDYDEEDGVLTEKSNRKLNYGAIGAASPLYYRMLKNAGLATLKTAKGVGIAGGLAALGAGVGALQDKLKKRWDAKANLRKNTESKDKESADRAKKYAEVSGTNVKNRIRNIKTYYKTGLKADDESADEGSGIRKVDKNLIDTRRAKKNAKRDLKKLEKAGVKTGEAYEKAKTDYIKAEKDHYELKKKSKDDIKREKVYAKAQRSNLIAKQVEADAKAAQEAEEKRKEEKKAAALKKEEERKKKEEEEKARRKAEEEANANAYKKASEPENVEVVDASDKKENKENADNNSNNNGSNTTPQLLPHDPNVIGHLPDGSPIVKNDEEPKEDKEDVKKESAEVVDEVTPIIIENFDFYSYITEANLIKQSQMSNGWSITKQGKYDEEFLTAKALDVIKSNLGLTIATLLGAISLVGLPAAYVTAIAASVRQRNNLERLNSDQYNELKRFVQADPKAKEILKKIKIELMETKPDGKQLKALRKEFFAAAKEAKEEYKKKLMEFATIFGEEEILNEEVEVAETVAETTDINDVKVDEDKVVETAEETTDVEEVKVDEDEVIETETETDGTEVGTCIKESVNYSSIREACLLEGYFCEDSYKLETAESKAKVLTEQVALTMAREAADPLFAELVEATAYAERLEARLLEKYGRVAANNVKPLI